MIVTAPTQVLAAAWTTEEREALQPLWKALEGQEVEVASATTDEGDPWFVVEAGRGGEVLLHMARLSRTYVVSDARSEQVDATPSIRRAVDLAIRRTSGARLRSGAVAR